MISNNNVDYKKTLIQSSKIKPMKLSLKMRSQKRKTVIIIRGGGVGQRVRGPTLTMKFEKWMNSICGEIFSHFRTSEIVFSHFYYVTEAIMQSFKRNIKQSWD